MRWRKLTKPSVVQIDGVKLDTSAGKLPDFVRLSVFREKYEDAERKLIAEALQPGMRVVEIGCGIGLVSLVATRICGEGKVVSFEANPALESTIRGNYALNGIAPNLHMRAVTADGQPISFFKSDNIVSSSLYDRQRQDEKITVESSAFADVLETHDPQALIMDIEGAEVDILASGDLKNVAHVIVELHPHIVGEEKTNGLIRGLERRGFAVRRRIHKTVYFMRTA